MSYYYGDLSSCSSDDDNSSDEEQCASYFEANNRASRSRPPETKPVHQDEIMSGEMNACDTTPSNGSIWSRTVIHLDVSGLTWYTFKKDFFATGDINVSLD